MSSSSKSSAETRTETNTTTTNIQETSSAAADGIVAGDLTQLQGKSITLNQEFSDDVAAAFGQLIDLTSSSINAAASVGDRALSASEVALDKVSERFEAQENPSLGALSKILPIIGLAIVVGGAVYYARSK